MIGQTLGHYRIEAQLGAGGMGVVYRARDTKLERSVALKVLGERMLSEPTARERFLREARTASALNHPHICTVHEVGEEDGQAFIVMEYVEGRRLSELALQGLPTDTVMRSAIQIADALSHAHERGIIHRDLKSSNVIITPEGRAKVLDFGLAKRLPTEDLREKTTRSEDSLTDAGQVMGTLHYMAPEVLRGQPADARTDIWALGVLLYELATGEMPFRGRTRFEVTAAALGEPPQPLPEGVPAGLRTTILRCLAKEPTERYQRASELRAALEAIQSGAHAPSAALASGRGFPRWTWGAAAGALALVAALVALPRLGGRRGGIESIAVLPFVNAAAAPETEYLSDGITESVIGSLSRLPHLKVIAFSSVGRYRGRTVDPKDVVRDLGVGAIVTGRVVQRGNTLSISVELVDTKDRSRMWGEQYNETLAKILTIQDDISRKISDQLRIRVTDEEAKRLTKRYTESSEAYQAYLKGRYYWYKFTPQSYQKSMEYYGQAIEKDPSYAQAYAGLADTYVSMAVEGLFPPRETLQKAEGAAKKALEIDESLGEAHVSVAGVTVFKDWDWAATEREYRRALELNPSLVPAHRFYAQFLRISGRWVEAVTEMKKALELDPLSVETTKSFGALYFWARQYDQAIEQYRKALEIDPNAADVHDLLAEAYARTGKFAQATAEKRQALASYGDEEAAAAITRDYAVAGYRGALRALAEKHLELLDDSSKEGYVSPMSYAYLYAFLEDREKAFAWLEKAYAEHSPWLIYLKHDPQFDSLRSDPRYAQLERRVGLLP